MSRRNVAPRRGPQLPNALLQKLGMEAVVDAGVRRHSRSVSGSGRPQFAGTRKEQRKEERANRGVAKASRYRKVSEMDLDEPARTPVVRRNPKVARANRPPPVEQSKSIQKKLRPAPPAMYTEDSDSDNRASSPGLVLDSSSRAFKERTAQDDDEIAALEKKLGLKTKKLPKSFNEDGLGDILEGLDSGEENKKRKREGNDWLERKRRKAQVQDQEDSSAEDDNLREDLSQISVSDDDILDEEDFARFFEDEDQQAPPPKMRENPYIAPRMGSEVSAAKYVPPSLRKAQNQGTEALNRIRRQIQGHLNKLSEANLISILNEIEAMYQSNARQDVSSTLIDLLLALFSDRSSLQSTFVILHASFVTAVYKVIGNDFRAEFVSRLVERLDSYANIKYDSTSKESNNLVSLLSYLFTFNVISSTLVFDYLRLYLETLNETNTELILRIVRDCGPQLRRDDPSSLKTIVQIMQKSSAEIAADGKETSVRTKFMIETITDLKNNKLRTATNGAGVASEHITRMRNALGSLNSRNLNGSEPLSISREDINNSDKKGKWWLVGASWKGNVEEDGSGNKPDGQSSNDLSDSDSEHVDLMALARQYRMNTDVRRSIFVSIMSALDFQDAHMRLLKLRLTRTQQQEIPKVLLHCAGAEQAYNPYYGLVAHKLCSEKKMKMAFQFSIWAFFKRLGEKGDGEESDDEENEPNVELREIVNLAKMYAELILDGVLTIGILKVLNLALLKDQTTNFLEVMFITITTGPAHKKKPSEKRLVDVFSKATDSPQLVKPLQYFIRKKVRKSDLVVEKDRQNLRRGCEIATDTLAMLEMTPSHSEFH
jgi:nucleolar MIF4G domain-containing protein 1